MIGWVSGCGDEEWRAAPLDGDPRPVAVVVDHVAHAYEYMAGWISQLVAGQPVEVNSGVVDALNARHAREATAVSKDEAIGHLRRSGAAISACGRPPRRHRNRTGRFGGNERRCLSTRRVMVAR